MRNFSEKEDFNSKGTVPEIGDKVLKIARDFYSASGKTLSEEKERVILSKYGDNYQKMLTDLYSASGKTLSPEKLKIVEKKYELLEDKGPPPEIPKDIVDFNSRVDNLKEDYSTISSVSAMTGSDKPVPTLHFYDHQNNALDKVKRERDNLVNNFNYRPLTYREVVNTIGKNSSREEEVSQKSKIYLENYTDRLKESVAYSLNSMSSQAKEVINLIKSGKEVDLSVLSDEDLKSIEDWKKKQSILDKQLSLNNSSIHLYNDFRAGLHRVARQAKDEDRSVRDAIVEYMEEKGMSTEGLKDIKEGGEFSDYDTIASVSLYNTKESVVNSFSKFWKGVRDIVAPDDGSTVYDEKYKQEFSNFLKDDIDQDIKKLMWGTNKTKYDGDIRELQVNVDGVNVMIDEDGNAIGIRKENGNQSYQYTDKELNAVEKYNENKEELSKKASHNFRGGSMLGKGTQVMTDMIPIIASTLTTRGLGGSPSLGTYLGTFSVSYGNYYDQQFAKTGDIGNATAFASAATTMTALLEGLGGVEGSVIKNVSKDKLSDIVQQTAAEVASESVIKGETAIKALVKNLKKEGLEETGIELLQSLGEAQMNIIFNNESELTLKDLEEVIILTPFATGPISLASAGIQGTFNNYEMEQLKIAARKKDVFNKIVDDWVGSSKTEVEREKRQKEADYKKSLVEELSTNLLAADELKIIDPKIHKALVEKSEDIVNKKKEIEKAKSDYTKNILQTELSEMQSDITALLEEGYKSKESLDKIIERAESEAADRLKRRKEKEFETITNDTELNRLNIVPDQKSDNVFEDRINTVEDYEAQYEDEYTEESVGEFNVKMSKLPEGSKETNLISEGIVESDGKVVGQFAVFGETAVEGSLEMAASLQETAQRKGVSSNTYKRVANQENKPILPASVNRDNGGSSSSFSVNASALWQSMADKGIAEEVEVTTKDGKVIRTLAVLPDGFTSTDTVKRIEDAAVEEFNIESEKFEQEESVETNMEEGTFVLNRKGTPVTYKIGKINTNKDGTVVSVTAIDQNGKTKTIRSKSVVAQLEADRLIHENKLIENEITEQELERAIADSGVSEDGRVQSDGSGQDTQSNSEEQTAQGNREDLLKQSVNYQGIQGTLVKNGDGSYSVITPDGDSILVEGGQSDATNGELGITRGKTNLELVEDEINEKKQERKRIRQELADAFVEVDSKIPPDATGEFVDAVNNMGGNNPVILASGMAKALSHKIGTTVQNSLGKKYIDNLRNLVKRLELLNKELSNKSLAKKRKDARIKDASAEAKKLKNERLHKIKEARKRINEGTTPETEKQNKVNQKAEPTEKEVSDIAQKAGITQRNFRDLYNINRKLFGLGRVKAIAAAVVMDRMIGAMAKRAGITKAEMYGRLEFRKDIEANVLKADNALFQGTVDGKPVTLRNIDVDVVNGFYSPLEKIISETKQEKMPAKQWLEKFARGDEAKWTGLADWLNQQEGSVSKQEILNFLKNNKVEIKEVTKTDRPFKEIKNKMFNLGNEWEEVYGGVEAKKSNKDGDRFNLRINGVEYQRDFAYIDAKSYIEANATVNPEKNRTKFSGYQLEGEKSDYKEVLVTLPSKIKPYSVIDKRDNSTVKTFDKYSDAVDFIESSRFGDNYDVKEDKSTIFKSTHFDEPNILVHLRMNIRTDADGNKVLFLEEVQSDWGQKGKKEGFDNKSEQRKELERRGVTFNQNGTVSLKSQDEFYEKGETWDLIKKYNDTYTNRSIAPQAPFVMDTNAWTKLGLKVALKEAVAQGVDKIAWTTGEQQNDRYDLRKQVDEIGYSYNYVANTYRIVGGKNGEPIFNSELKESELESNLGKDVASKIISDKDNSIGKMNFLRGDDLAVGGKGMKGFYGSMEEGTKGIVGGVAEKLFGQKVGKTKIFKDQEDITKYKVYDRMRGNIIAEFTRESDAKKYIRDNAEIGDDWDIISETTEGAKGTAIQPSIDITPELRAEVERGLALFQRQQGQQAKGAMVAADGSFVIYALTDPNVSTPLHELAHVFEHYLTDAEKAAVQSWAGTKGWTTQTSEKFARGFEKYLADGKAPTSALQKVFDKFKQWMLDIYNGITGSDIDIELNDSMRDIYAKMMGVNTGSVREVTETSEVISDKVWDDYVNTGKVPQQVLEKLADHFQNGTVNSMSQREFTIFSNMTPEINKILLNRSAEGSYKKKTEKQVIDNATSIMERRLKEISNILKSAGFTNEQILATAEIFSKVAKRWARLNNKTEAQFYSEVLLGVEVADLGGKRKAATKKVDGGYIIELSEGISIDSPIHELAHIFENFLTDVEKKEVLKWSRERNWNKDTSEKFARGFIKFLESGDSDGLNSNIFKKFKQWLSDIYHGLITYKGKEIPRLNVEMKNIFTKMLNSEVPIVNQENYESAQDTLDGYYKKFEEVGIKFKKSLFDSIAKMLDIDVERSDRLWGILPGSFNRFKYTPTKIRSILKSAVDKGYTDIDVAMAFVNDAMVSMSKDPNYLPEANAEQLLGYGYALMTMEEGLSNLEEKIKKNPKDSGLKDLRRDLVLDIANLAQILSLARSEAGLRLKAGSFNLAKGSYSVQNIVRDTENRLKRKLTQSELRNVKEMSAKHLKDLQELEDKIKNQGELTQKEKEHIANEIISSGIFNNPFFKDVIDSVKKSTPKKRSDRLNEKVNNIKNIIRDSPDILYDEEQGSTTEELFKEVRELVSILTTINPEIDSFVSLHENIEELIPDLSQDMLLDVLVWSDPSYQKSQADKVASNSAIIKREAKLLETIREYITNTYKSVEKSGNKTIYPERLDTLDKFIEELKFLSATDKVITNESFMEAMTHLEALQVMYSDLVLEKVDFMSIDLDQIIDKINRYEKARKIDKRLQDAKRLDEIEQQLRDGTYEGDLNEYSVSISDEFVKNRLEEYAAKIGLSNDDNYKIADRRLKILKQISNIVMRADGPKIVEDFETLYEAVKNSLPSDFDLTKRDLYSALLHKVDKPKALSAEFKNMEGVVKAELKALDKLERFFKKPVARVKTPLDMKSRVQELGNIIDEIEKLSRKRYEYYSDETLKDLATRFGDIMDAYKGILSGSVTSMTMEDLIKEVRDIKMQEDLEKALEKKFKESIKLGVLPSNLKNIDNIFEVLPEMLPKIINSNIESLKKEAYQDVKQQRLMKVDKVLEIIRSKIRENTKEEFKSSPEFQAIKEFLEVRKKSDDLKSEVIRLNRQVYLKRHELKTYIDSLEDGGKDRLFAKIINTPRLLVLAGDISFVTYQGGVMLASHPIHAAKAFKQMALSAFSTKNWLESLENIKRDDYYDSAIASGLKLVDETSLELEEELRLTTILDNFRLFREFRKFGERLHSSYMNNLRFSIFKQMMEVQGIDYLMGGRNKYNDLSERQREVVRMISEEINMHSGSATNFFGSNQVNDSFNNLLNAGTAVFIAPRLYASVYRSTASMLGSVVGRDVLRTNKLKKAGVTANKDLINYYQKRKIRNLRRLGALSGFHLAMLAMFTPLLSAFNPFDWEDGEDERDKMMQSTFNPFSGNFLKLQKGQRVFSISPFVSYYRTAFRLLGEVLENHEIIDPNYFDKSKEMDRKKGFKPHIWDFFKYRFTPFFSSTETLLTNTNWDGTPVTTKDNWLGRTKDLSEAFLKNTLAPIWLQGVIENYAKGTMDQAPYEFVIDFVGINSYTVSPYQDTEVSSKIRKEGFRISHGNIPKNLENKKDEIHAETKLQFGMWLKNEIDKGRNPTKEAMRRKSRQISNQVISNAKKD